jgi:hypothetical protein
MAKSNGGWEDVPSDGGWEDVPSAKTVSQPSTPFTQMGQLRPSDLITSRLGSRLMGTPEGMTAGDQFKKMYDRSQDHNMPWEARFANSAATGMAGDVVDMSLNPMTYAAGLAMKPVASLIGKGISSAMAKTGLEISPKAAKIEQGIQKFIGSIFKAKGEASKLYGAELDALVAKSPTAMSDLSTLASDLKQQASFNPRLQSAIKKSSKLDALVTEFEQTGQANRSVKDIQAILNEYKSVNKGAFSAKNVDPLQREVQSVAHDLKHEQGKLFPNEMKDINAKYAQVANDFKTIRNKLSPNTAESFIRGKFGGTIQENAVKRLLKNDPESFKMAKKLSGGMAFDAFKKDMLRRAAGGAVTALGAGTAASLFFKHYFNKNGD